MFKNIIGNTYDFTDDILERIVLNFKRTPEKIPIVLGHPLTDSPAMGWVKDLRANNGYLEAQYEDISEELKKNVADGRYRYKSISIDGGLNRLKHIGVLGGVAPAMSGLGSIQFQKSNNGVIFCFADNEESDMTIEELATKLEEQQDELTKCREDIEALKNAIAQARTENPSFSRPTSNEVSGLKMVIKL